MFGSHGSGGRAGFRLFAFVALLWLAVLAPRRARADLSAAHTVSVAVLSFDSDDAEDQADALTGALRSRVRASQGWSLIETTQTLGMLTAALRCPSRPMSADCEQRVGEQLKADRYIFGYVKRGPEAGRVTAEIHLYQRNKPSTVIRETYADNLKDQNDDTVRKIAQGVLDRLAGSAVGTIAVRMGTENGEIIVDGDKHLPLQNGTAQLEVSPGGHSVEVAVPGRPAQKRNVLVTAGKETLVEIAIVAPAPAETPKGKPFPTRKVIGGGLVVAGLAVGVVTLVNVLSYLDDQDRALAFENANLNPADRKLPPNKTADEACGVELKNDTSICKMNADANRHSTIAWATGIGAGVAILAGTYFLLTDGGSNKEKSASSKKPRVAPTFGSNSGGVILSGSF